MINKKSLENLDAKTIYNRLILLLNDYTQNKSVDEDSINGLKKVIFVFENGFKKYIVEDHDSEIWFWVANLNLKDVCLFLLNNNIEENRYSTDDSALMIASRMGHFDIVKMLVENGCNPNHATDVSCESPLTCAAYSGNEKIFFYLLEHGATLTYKWIDSEISQIGEKAEINSVDLLFYAFKGGNSKICKYLIEHIDNINLIQYSNYLKKDLIKIQRICKEINREDVYEIINKRLKHEL